MRIGLFFGSFNPIHIGHMAIANYVVEFGPIDQLWFVVSPQNPFKHQKNLLDDYQRLELVNRAIGDHFPLKACHTQLRLPRPSYTINTLAYLSEKYPNKTFMPIIGADNFEQLHRWKNIDVLLQNYEFIVYPRPGYSLTNNDVQGIFHIVEAPIMEISSTFIRNAMAQGKDVRHFLQPQVFQYIDEMKFYC